MPSIIVRDLSLRQGNAFDVTFSKFELDFWKIRWTRAGNIRFPGVEAATYAMVRLYDTAMRLGRLDPKTSPTDALNAKGAETVADELADLIVKTVARDVGSCRKP